MPVSTRSQIITTTTNNEQSQELRNPHHGLKEKMRALTLLYEQQKRASLSLKNNTKEEEEDKEKEEEEEETESRRLATHPSVELFNSSKKQEARSNRSSVMRENSMMLLPNPTVITRTYVLPNPNFTHHVEAKENIDTDDGDRILSFAAATATSCPVRKGKGLVARKLSMGNNNSETKIEERVGNSESRISVFVRLRPMGKREREAGSRCCVRIVNCREVYLTEFLSNINDYLRLKRLRGRHFAFDASFTDTTSQLEVYSTTTAELVEAVLQGRNGSVFCYGATGAGKTYTMLGTLENPGVMVLAIKDLFTKIRQRSCDGSHVVHLSYLEVYNETVRDLLSPGRPLVLREDKQGIVAAGLTQYRAYSTDEVNLFDFVSAEVMALLLQGNRNRTTEPTRANETSSRSHAILQVVVEYRVRDEAMNIVNRIGKLSLIDLAGSERALATDQRTLRSLEGANINRSLLALSSCINALVEGKRHVPYRNSKLTQLLKDSLGGACNTVMIANISPSNLSFGETQNTLHWADRAKEIRTKPCKANEEVQQAPESETDQAKLLLELQRENRDLRVQLARQQQKVITLQAQSLAMNFSPTPSSITSTRRTPPSTALPNEKRRPRTGFLGGTPDEGLKDLQRTIKALEAEIERMKRDHLLEVKKKDEQIRELSSQQKSDKLFGHQGTKRVVTRASLRPKEPTTGELKSPSHRFRSPVPAAAAKKRSFWDISTSNSPSVATINSRKTKSHVVSELGGAPSMLLQVLLDKSPSVYGRKIPGFSENDIEN